MSGKPFDASLKDVIEAHAADWARLLGAVHPRNVRVIDADVSTVTAAADKALLVEDDAGEYVLHPELQSSYNPGVPKRIWWYNSVYHQRFDMPVLSTAVLLRPEADGPAMSGRYEVRVPKRTRPYHIFEYDVLRLWQVPVETLLAGGIGILPLAPLANDAAGQLPDVLRTIDQRLSVEAERDDADKLRAATSILMSLRHPAELIHQLLKGMWPMWENVLEDSSIIKEYVQRAEQRGVKIGEERGVKIGEERANARFRESLLRLGEKRFGPPDPVSRAAIEDVTDPDRLAMLGERVLEVTSWNELLA
jgi:predicted transposase YdaD